MHTLTNDVVNGLFRTDDRWSRERMPYNIIDYVEVHSRNVTICRIIFQPDILDFVMHTGNPSVSIIIENAVHILGIY